ncbi:hypothetical protein L596_014030 [Steinernema carpocapsae]|uniref:Cullin protein neddylation domain-containing protein n=1 Tax=Steinernema carpocapsae TaxID=34508 RepID=A0A4U5NB69_STECR|nr:hypothetical protein L596_014030 [Steinernema carpocapsae]
MFKDISVSQDTMNLFRDYLCRRVCVSLRLAGKEYEDAPGQHVPGLHPPALQSQTDAHLQGLSWTIVRVMKAPGDAPRAAYGRGDQSSESAFPSPQMIKERVESLIERDYLGRDTKDRRIIKYMS